MADVLRSSVKSMSDERFNERKKELKDDLELLKKDIKVLEKIVSYVEENIDTLTKDTADAFDDHMIELEDELSVLTIFT